MVDDDSLKWELEEYRQASDSLRYANRQIHLFFYLYCFVLLGFSQLYLTSLESSILYQISVVLLAILLFLLLTLNAYSEITTRDILKDRQEDIENVHGLNVGSEVEEDMDPEQAKTRIDKFTFTVRKFHFAHAMLGISLLWVLLAITNIII